MCKLSVSESTYTFVPQLDQTRINCSESQQDIATFFAATLNQTFDDEERFVR